MLFVLPEYVGVIKADVVDEVGGYEDNAANGAMDQYCSDEAVFYAGNECFDDQGACPK